MANAVDLIIRVIADTKKASSDISAAGKDVSGFASGVKKAAVPAAIALAALGAAAISAGNAAAEDAQAAAILATNLKNSANATDTQVAATEAFIDKTAKATGVADDQLRPAMSKLALATGDVETSQSALSQALDISAATGKDVETVAGALAKAYGGSTTSLKKLVPSLSDATLASGDMNAIMAELADTTGGAAAAAADTTAGKMAIMQVKMQEAQEEIGSALLPVLTALAGLLSSVAAFAQRHPAIFIAIAAAIGIMAAAIIALNIAMGIYTAVVTLAGEATAAAWLAAAGPIALVIIAVIAVIAIIVILWKHSETFRDIVLGVWDAIRTAAIATWNFIKAAGMAVWNAITSAASATAGFVVAAWDKIKSGAEAAFNWVKSNWPLLLAIITGPIGLAVLAVVRNWDKIRAGAGTAFDLIKSAWDTLIGALKTAASGLASILTAPFTAMQNAIQWVIDKVNALISSLSRIHVPHIDLPGPLSMPAPANARGAATGYAAPGVQGARRGTRRAATGAAIVVNVTGAVDPEATARQIRRILAGHDRRVGLAT